MIDAMIDDLGNFSFDNTYIGTITQTASQYNSDIYNNVVIKFMKDVSFGAGAALLTIFMLMELIAILQRNGGDNSGIMGIKLPANILIKWAIVTFLYCRLSIILDGIQQISANMATNAVISASAPGSLSGDMSAAKAAIDSLGLVEKALACTIVVLEWLIFNLFKSLVSVAMIFRMFELWLLLMFAPIPLATLPSQEFRQTAINFIKLFTSVCLTGVIIMATFMLYSKFITGKFAALPADATFLVFAQQMVLNLLYLSVLVVTVFSAGKISKSMLHVI